MIVHSAPSSFFVDGQERKSAFRNPKASQHHHSLLEFSRLIIGQPPGVQAAYMQVKAASYALSRPCASVGEDFCCGHEKAPRIFNTIPLRPQGCGFLMAAAVR